MISTQCARAYILIIMRIISLFSSSSYDNNNSAMNSAMFGQVASRRAEHSKYIDYVTKVVFIYERVALLVWWFV